MPPILPSPSRQGAHDHLSQPIFPSSPVLVLRWTLLGGLGTPFGPALGAAFLTLVSEFLGTRLVYYYLIVIGAIIVAISLFAPGGLAGVIALARGRRAEGVA